MLNLRSFRSCLKCLPGNVKVLSFDVFDTLLIRMVRPERVARLASEAMSRRFYEETNLTLKISEIIKSRFEFKRQKDKDYFFHEAEWTLSEWLNDLAEKRSLDPAFLCRIGRNAELAAESDCLFRIPDASNLLSEAKDKGLIVIALSDIWLDRDWLEELLEGFGLYFDRVFSSGAMGASKRRGSIFQRVQRELGFEADAFVHFGDNLKADFIRPRLSGWRSILVSRPCHHFSVRKLPVLSGDRLFRKSWKDIIQSLNYSPEKKGPDPFFNLAYNYLAPLLIIFSIVQWRRFRNQGIEIVFYIARDARAMFDVYNIIERFLPGSSPRRYIRLSRRAVAIAHPDDFLQNVMHLPGKMGRKKVYEWIGNFTISSDLRRELLLLSGVNESDDFTPSARDAVRHGCRQLLPGIIEEQDHQKQLIRDYLQQEAGTVPLRKVGIVDTGWACTIQDSIRAILSESELVSGIYLGVSRQGRKPDNQNKKLGILRDDFRKRQYHNPLESTAGVVRMWDTLLREPCGSVIQLYRKDDNSVDAMMDDGKVLGGIERRAADSIRQGIFEGTCARMKGVSLVVKLSEQFSDADFEIAATEISRNISTHPTRDIAKAIIQLGFDEGTAAGKKGALSGREGLKNGVAWYPGVMAGSGMRWMSPFIEMVARVILKKLRLNKEPSSPNFHNGNRL